MLLNAAPTRRLNRALDRVWYVASAPQTLAALLALVAVTLAFAAAFPQAPAGLDSAASGRWYSSMNARFGGAAPVLLSLGAFDVLDGPWLALLLATLGLNLALRLAAQLRFLFRPASAGDIPLPPAGLFPAQIVLQVTIDDVCAAAHRVLRAEFGTAVVANDGPRVQVFAERRGAGRYGAALAYLGGLFLILGLLLDATFGWRATGITLAQGSPVTLSQGSGLRIMLERVEGSSVGGAEGSAAPAILQLTSGGGTHLVRASATWPGRWGNLLVAERATGPALTVSAQDAAARPLLVQSLAAGGEVGETLKLLFDQTQSEQAFAIPTRDLTLRAVYYPSLPDQGITRPVYQVEAYRGAETMPAASVLVDESAQVEVAGVRLSVRGDRYVDLEAAYLPGLAPLLLGGLLILAGAILSAAGSVARAWVDLAPCKEGVRVVVRVAAAALPVERAEHLLAQVTLEPSQAPLVSTVVETPVVVQVGGQDAQP